MKAVWITDIHLNFVEGDGIPRFLSLIVRKNPDIVLFTGDIGEADSVSGYLTRLEQASEGPIYFVLGNHDFYGSSVASVRAKISSLVHASAHLHWMNEEGVVPLTSRTALIGHDSWPDGRLGDYAHTDVELNDFYLIEEVTSVDRSERLSAMQALADEAADHLGKTLSAALEDHPNVIAITHVPPFQEASWHDGQPSNDDFLPFFSCLAVGESFVEVMQQHPSECLTVLCGHTHGEGTCQILPNLTVHTGCATYGRPAIVDILDIE